LKWKNFDFLLCANEKENYLTGEVFSKRTLFLLLSFSGKRTSSIDVTKVFILPFPCPGYQDMLPSQVNQHNDKDDGYHGDSYGNHHWRHN